MQSLWAALLFSLGIGKTIPVVNLPVVTPTITPTPTVHQLTFAELNQKFGPCANLPVLMYHHIQEPEIAKTDGYDKLNVTPEWFRKHLEYLRENKYTVIGVDELARFFDEGKALPQKSVVITLDDAYEDNFLYAWNILKEFGAKATVFTPTGLVSVHGYLNWDQIREMGSSNLVYFGNHTWSHHPSTGSTELLDKEIRLADTQLSEKGLNAYKVFAYPYGPSSKNAESVLKKYGYSLAFTTTRGKTQCKAKRYELPRIRVGNAPLSKFGL